MKFTFVLMLVVGLIFTGCQTKPTKTSQSRSRTFGAKSDPPVVITPLTLVVDARPAFDYSTAHIPHSVPLNWADFTEAEPAQSGLIQFDTEGATRRLARAGIAPTSHVVVVGRGLLGSGEEGRVAWMLTYLGVADVQFAALDSLKARLTNETESQPPKSVSMWKPTLSESLNATRSEVLFAINQNAFVKPVSYKGSSPRTYKFIDVRSERAYLGKEGIGAIKQVPNMEAINIPWAQFFTSALRPKTDVMDRLRSMGYRLNDRIIVLDENGVASAAVTMALRSYGFVDAANDAGGLQDLIP